MKLQSMWMTMSLGMLPVLFMLGGCVEQKGVPRAQLDDSLQDVLERVVQDGTIPGVSIHLQSPALGTWSGAAGLGNLKTKRAMASSDKFRAGSIMKTFVAVVTMQLVEEGRFFLDTPMSEILPKNVIGRFGNGDQITVRMLLNHTAGIAEWDTDEIDAEIFAHPHKIWQELEQLDLAAAHGPTFAPGEGWAYSNTHFVLLGQMIEKTTGRSWREEVNERIIQKLDLKKTRLPEPGDRSVSSDHARGYQLIDSKFVDLTDVDPSMAGAAGGHALETTAADLVKFLDAVVAGQFFEQKKTMDDMLQFVDAPDEDGVPYYYGLGIEKYVLPGGIEIIGHAGTTAGFASIVYYLPKQNLTVSVVISTQDLASVYFKVLMPVLEVLKPALMS